MQKTIYLCDWLPPDFGAVGQYSMHFARERASAGEEVVLAGLSSSRASVVSEQVGSGWLIVLRMRSTPCDRRNLVRRLLWTLRTNVRLLWHVRRQLWRADQIVFTGSPPFLLHFLVPLNILLRRRLVYRITDFHPECLMVDLERVPLILKLLYRLTIFWRRRVHCFEVLGADQRRRLKEIGISGDRVVMKRDFSPVEFSDSPEPLIVPETLRDHALLLYSGNFGVAHDHQTFVEGYRRHHQEGSGRTRLWLNATGAKADLVERVIREAGLPLFRSRPLSLEKLARLMVTADVHLITLRDPFVGFVMPSKVYACIASGRDILYVGSEASDIHLLCKERLPEAGYHCVPLGHPERVAAALEALAERAMALADNSS